MEGLEPSQPKLLEPKPSASTNSATPVKVLKYLKEKGKTKNMITKLLFVFEIIKKNTD